MKVTAKNNLLTAYGLNCGYVQRTNECELYKEHGVYHVRGGGRWLTFDKLAEARKEFNKLSK